MVEREGFLKPSKASSRMKRYIRKARKLPASRLHPERCSARKAPHRMRRSMVARLPIWWAWKAASPALYGQQDDIVENIDEKKLASNVDFLMELLKNM